MGRKTHDIDAHQVLCEGLDQGATPAGKRQCFINIITYMSASIRASVFHKHRVLRQITMILFSSVGIMDGSFCQIIDGHAGKNSSDKRVQSQHRASTKQKEF